MTDFKVTDGMVEAGHGAGMRHWGTREAITAALAHPDFRAQVAELMRGIVPGRDSDGDSFALGHNHCRAEFFDRIQQWEEGA